MGTSGLAAAILDYGLPLTPHNIRNSPIEFLGPENGVVAVEISLLSFTEAEIWELPVWRPPSWIMDFR